MGGIAGMLDFDIKNFRNQKAVNIFNGFNNRVDDISGSGIYCINNACLCASFAASDNIFNIGQPFFKTLCGELYCVVFDGVILNATQIKSDLIERGHTISSSNPAELALCAYIEWGYDCLKKLNGYFAFAVYEDTYQRLFLARDVFCQRPLYFSLNDNKSLYFASEIGVLLSSGLKPDIKKQNLPALFAPSPNLTPFSDIYSLGAGECAIFSPLGFYLHSFEHYIHNVKSSDQKSYKDIFINAADTSLREKVSHFEFFRPLYLGDACDELLNSLCQDKRFKAPIDKKQFFNGDASYDMLPFLIDEVVNITETPVLNFRDIAMLGLIESSEYPLVTSISKLDEDTMAAYEKKTFDNLILLTQDNILKEILLNETDLKLKDAFLLSASKAEKIALNRKTKLITPLLTGHISNIIKNAPQDLRIEYKKIDKTIQETKLDMTSISKKLSFLLQDLSKETLLLIDENKLEDLKKALLKNDKSALISALRIVSLNSFFKNFKVNLSIE